MILLDIIAVTTNGTLEFDLWVPDDCHISKTVIEYINANETNSEIIELTINQRGNHE